MQVDRALRSKLASPSNLTNVELECPTTFLDRLQSTGCTFKRRRCFCRELKRTSHFKFVCESGVASCTRQLATNEESAKGHPPCSPWQMNFLPIQPTTLISHRSQPGSRPGRASVTCIRSLAATRTQPGAASRPHTLRLTIPLACKHGHFDAQYLPRKCLWRSICRLDAFRTGGVEGG